MNRTITILLILAFSLVAFGQEQPKVAEQPKPEVKQMDRSIVVEIQLVQSQIDNLQLRAQLLLNDWMDKQNLKKDEWTVDLQKMTLTKKEQPKPAK